MAVLGSVACDHLVVSVISQKRKIHFENMSTWFNQPQNSMTLLDLLFSRYTHVLHVFLYEFVFTDNTRKSQAKLTKTNKKYTKLYENNIRPFQRILDCQLLECL